MPTKINTTLFLAISFSMMACQKASTGYTNNNNNGSGSTGSGVIIQQTVVFDREFIDQSWIPSGYFIGSNELGYIIIDIPELTHITYYYLSIQQKTASGDWEEVEYRPDVMSAISAYMVGSLRQNFYIDEAWQNGRIRIYNPFRRNSPVTVRIRAIR